MSRSLIKGILQNVCHHDNHTFSNENVEALNDYANSLLSDSNQDALHCYMQDLVFTLLSLEKDSQAKLICLGILDYLIEQQPALQTTVDTRMNGIWQQMQARRMGHI